MDPANAIPELTAAALVTQFALLLITAIGIGLLAERARPWQLFVYFVLYTLGVLIFSNDIMSRVGGLLGGVNLSGISYAAGVRFMFVADVIAVSVFVRITGGTRSSPFTPILFIIPALAIFLKENFVWVAVYTALTLGGFAGGSRYTLEDNRFWDSSDWAHEERRRQRMAFVAVGSACLVLGTVVGFLTRSA